MDRQQLASWNPSRDVWETGAVDLFSGHSGVFSETLPKSGSMRSGQLFERPTLEPHTVGRESSFSPGRLALLRTPCAAEAAGGPRNPNRPGATMRLSDQIREEMEAGVIRA